MTFQQKLFVVVVAVFAGVSLYLPREVNMSFLGAMAACVVLIVIPQMAMGTSRHSGAGRVYFLTDLLFGAAFGSTLGATKYVLFGSSESYIPKPGAIYGTCVCMSFILFIIGFMTMEIGKTEYEQKKSATRGLTQK